MVQKSSLNRNGKAALSFYPDELFNGVAELVKFCFMRSEVANHQNCMLFPWSET